MNKSAPFSPLYGYVYIKIPILGVAALTFLILSASALIVWKLSANSSTNVKLGLTGWLATLTSVAFAFPISGVKYGQEQAVSDIKNIIGIDVPEMTLPIRHNNVRQREIIEGLKILAKKDHTFLIAGNIVYKIENSSGKIFRSTQLRERPVATAWRR